MWHKMRGFGMTPFVLGIFASLVVIVLFFFSPVNLSHAQTTENRSPSFEQFEFTFTVDENTPVGEAIGTVEAIDPDGDSLHFALTNGHTDLFSIDSGTGQLRTKASLDYETKPEEDYWLHVAVRDGQGPGGERDLVADDQGLVVIQVTDGDEPGTLSLNWRRPEIGIPQVATLTDPNGLISAESWQWSRSSSRSNGFTSISGATSASYTPVVGDRDNYLRVSVNYTDGQGPNKSAGFTFGNMVAGTAAATRGTLGFPEGASTTRSIVENSPTGANIGSPVRATGGSQLRYALVGTDASSFTILPWSGQLQVKAALDYESKNSYSLTVEVADTSGGSDSIDVIVSVTNQPVEIHGPSRVEFSENDFIYSPVVAENYTIEPTGATLTLSGSDARHFTLTSAPGTGTHGRLKFNEEPDYEAPRDGGRNNVYNVTINATAETGGSTHTARLNVQVAVTNYNEGPVITGPTAVEFTEQTTGPVARYSATDPERDPIRWEIQDTDDWTYFRISSSGVLYFREAPDYESMKDTKPVYEVVVLAQSGMNAATDGTRVSVTVVDGADPPLFDQGYSEPRTVSENAAPDTSIGQPVSARGGPGATLAYTLSGTHGSHFAIDSTTGQLKTRAALNYEARNSYSVAVRASDGSLATNAPVTINVINEDEDGAVTLSPSSPRARVPMTARLTDPDGGVTGTTWQWESSTDQSSWTTIAGATSDAYSPADEDVGKYLRATASYTDGHGSGKTAAGHSTNTVGTGPNRSPSLSNSGTSVTRTVQENTQAGENIGEPVTATDPDGDTLTYTLAGSYASDFSIVSASGQLKTRAALNYESKNSYTLVIRARDPSNSYVNVTVNITVTDVDEPGSVSLSTSQPRVDAAVTATLSDPDSGTSNTTWQWSLADTATGTGQNIGGATGRSYTPVAGDLNKFLGVTVTYEDKFGTGKTVQSGPSQVGAARAPRNSGGGNDNPGNNGGGDLNQPPGTGSNPVVTRTVSVAFGSTNYGVNEGGAAQVTVRLSSAAPSSLQVPVAISRGTAESGDYRVSGLSGGALNFTQGSRSASFIITALQDNDTDNETLNLSFGTLSQSTLPGSKPRATLTIQDDDVASITLTYGSANYLVNEGEAAQITVRLSAGAPSAMSVPVTVSRGTAESGDYRVSGLSGGALNFTQGSRIRSFTITALQDDDADDETLTLGLGTLPQGVSLGAARSATLTIQDDDVAMTVSYGSANYRVNEGGAAQVTVRLSAAMPSTFRVPVTVSRGTAESGDYRVSGLSGGALNFSQGSSTRSFTITALQDDDSDDETLNLGFGSLPGIVTAGSTVTATLTINDDEGPPPLQLNVYYRSARFAVTEGHSISVTVRLSAVSDRPLIVPITAIGQTAEAGDYRLSGLTNTALHFAPGDRTQSFTFTARQDDDADDEQVLLGFGSLPANVVAGSWASGTVTIEDDDDHVPPMVKTVNGPPAFTEGDTTDRTVSEQAAQGTSVGLPVTAVDPDGDALTYYLSGVDASQFSLNPRTGQLRVFGQLDLETKATHLLNLSVSDGKGGTDFIVVVVNLSDTQEVAVPSPSTQSVGLVEGEAPLFLETPDGSAAVTLPLGVGEAPFFVRVESAAVNCGGHWPAGEEQALITVQLYDSRGIVMHDARAVSATASLRFDAQVLGGVAAAYAVHENGGIQVYGYRNQEGDWRPHGFTMDVDELGVVVLTVADLSVPICLVAVTHPVSPDKALSLAGAASEPEAEQEVGRVSNQRRRPGSSGREPIYTSIPVIDVGGGGGTSGGSTIVGPMVVQAGMVRELPWWPRLLLVLGTALLLGALAWQFSQAIRQKRLYNKTFTKPRNSILKDIFRA